MGSKGRVISIEPEPESFEVLKKNIELNKLANVIALNIACWNEERELDLYTAPSLKTSGSHSIKEKVSPNSVKVKSLKLDTILGNMGIEKVDFIKVDVEGSKVEVLEGAQRTIAKSDHVKILFEAFSKENLEECREILKKHKISIKHVYSNNFTSAEDNHKV